MKTHISERAKIALVSFICAYIAKWIFDYGSAWLYEQTVVSYEEGWITYIIREKIALHVFSALVAFIAALIYHPTWRIGIYSGIAAAVTFRLIDIWTYALASKAWLEYRGFVTPILSATLIGGVFGFLAVSRQFYKSKAEPV